MASSLLLAPISITISLIFVAFPSALLAIKCGGFAAIIPGIYLPLASRTYTLLAGNVFSTHPPKGRKTSVPLGFIACTIKPTSSLCASNKTLALRPMFVFD